MAAVADPVESGLAASLARPGGNVTGLTSATAELAPKRLELLKALVPKMTPRRGVRQPRQRCGRGARWKETEQAARAHGHRAACCSTCAARRRSRPAFEQAVRSRADALLVGIETLAQSNRDAIVELAAKHRLPAMYSAREFVDAGGLVSYGVDYSDLYYRAAGYADRIFKGARPAELPIERPAKFSLFINRRTANVARRRSFRPTSCCAPTGPSTSGHGALLQRLPGFQKRRRHGNEDGQGAAPAIAGARDGRREGLRDGAEMRGERGPEGRVGEVSRGNREARAGFTRRVPADEPRPGGADPGPQDHPRHRRLAGRRDGSGARHRRQGNGANAWPARW